MDVVSSKSVLPAEGLGREFLLHHRLCPIRRTPNGGLVVAATQDARLEGLPEIEFAYGVPVEVEAITPSALEREIERLMSRAEAPIALERPGGDEDDLTTDVRRLADQPPVVRYVNLLVRDAFDAGASDIHLDATPAGPLVRFRLDGVLSTAPDPPAGLFHAVVSRLKLLAELDIAERRRPQDGRIRVRLESRDLDLRVSTVPTIHGESVVLRLLDQGGRPVSLAELGMPSDVRDAVARLAGRPHGLLVVTGPTGSGKTTTLYATLALRDAHTEKIVTVEDPAEYQLPGVTQVPVHRGASVTFASALRSILRQDPDVIMVGETRDPETAEIAIQAALTGHLVLSTLHTNDAVSAVPRMLDLGTPAFLLAATLEGVLAQRLVRRVCVACREPTRPTDDVLARLGEAAPTKGQLMRGAGCASCRRTGYRGRVGLYELLCVTDRFRDAIARGASRVELDRTAREDGLRSLCEDGWAKVATGVTTVEEVLRVTQE